MNTRVCRILSLVVAGALLGGLLQVGEVERQRWHSRLGHARQLGDAIAHQLARDGDDRSGALGGLGESLSPSRTPMQRPSRPCRPCKGAFNMQKLSMVEKDYHSEQHVVGNDNTGDRQISHLPSVVHERR